MSVIIYDTLKLSLLNVLNRSTIGSDCIFLHVKFTTVQLSTLKLWFDTEFATIYIFSCQVIFTYVLVPGNHWTLVVSSRVGRVKYRPVELKLILIKGMGMFYNIVVLVTTLVLGIWYWKVHYKVYTQSKIQCKCVKIATMSFSDQSFITVASPLPWLFSVILYMRDYTSVYFWRRHHNGNSGE